ncbi:hypothetical protein V1520DRAFT_331546 [Lipomyces starkeyi]|uniref:Uncharacterized protein n=1 Tax=Lipomyces starkeyi NRRL Y-11557 TaxID=675824 RepID=A0A1E3Q7U6_LIPST|nr:hypothetical protein LIPSTDRAFT_2911 [Lipomyces starkeyi NRRL Y-11557]
MFSRISQNVKQAWNKTVQEFHEFEAQQDAKRQDRRRALQARVRRNVRLQGLVIAPPLSAAGISSCENGTINLENVAIDNQKNVDGEERKKKRKVSNGETTTNSIEQFHQPRARSTVRSTSPKIRLAANLEKYEDNLLRVASRETTRDTASSANSPRQARQSLISTRSACMSSGTRPTAILDTDNTAVERMLRKKIVHLERELRESRELIQRLHEQLGEQDDYIRAMEFEKSRVEDSRDDGRSEGENDAHDDIEYGYNIAEYATNRQHTRQRQREKCSPNVTKSSKSDNVEAVDDKLFEQMSPVPLADLIAQAAE